MKSAPHLELTNQRLRQRLQEQVAINELGENLLDWLAESSLVRAASMEELATKLEAFRFRVERYFCQELELADALIQEKGPTSQVISARTRTASQRTALLKRLNSAIRELKASMPGTEPWHKAVYELGLIADAIDLYEDTAEDLVSLVGHN